MLNLAAGLFAERGYKNTTVRDIADAAGILSGSLYHHFDSKETMADEILRTFLDELFRDYRAIVERENDPRRAFEQLVDASFQAIDRNHAAIALYQNEARQLRQSPRFAYLDDTDREFREIWLGTLEKGTPPGRSARIWTPPWPTASCATPCGSRCGGTCPAASSPPRRSRRSTSP